LRLAMIVRATIGGVSVAASTSIRLKRFAWLVTHRELLRTLLRRELRARYMGAALGVLWSYLQPLMMVLVYTLVFGVLFGGNRQIPHYPLFILTGIAVWNFFQGGLIYGTSSIVANAGLVKKIYFPRAVVPTAYVLAQGVTSLVMLAVVVPLNLIFDPRNLRTCLLAVPMLVGLLLLTLGMAWALAALNVFYRDIEHFLTIIVMPWFFLTPVLYKYELLPGTASRPWLTHILRYANPITPYIEGIRAALFEGVVVGPGELVYMAIVGPVFAVVGAGLLYRWEDRFAVDL
jgi:lipopolysaccharide transport system permease protein